MAISLGEVKPRDRAEITALNERIEPGSIQGIVWPELLRRPDFRDLAHVILEHATTTAPGIDPVAVARYEGIIEGAALVAKGLLEPAEEAV